MVNANGFFSALSVTFALLVYVTALSDDRRNDTSRLKIMTFNAEFLFDGIAPEGGADFPWKNSRDEALEHMARVAEVIKSANADIVNLVEVENLSTIEEMNSTFLPGLGYKAYLIDGTDNATGQDVGLLTRVDPKSGQIERTNEKGRSGSTEKTVSKNYYGTFDISGTSIAVIGLHFLARPLDVSRKVERQAQADAIRALAVKLASEGNEIVVCGDFNDFDMACMDLQGSTPISTVMADIRGMNASDLNDDLINIACSSNFSQSERYTAWWDKNQDNLVQSPGELSSIDHMLVSPGLAARLESVDIVHATIGAEVSDHFPIVASISFGPSETVPSAPLASVYISKVLANPDGDESENEAIWITNSGASDITLDGWKVQDKARTTWDLTSNGTVKANETKMVMRQRRQMSINNGGDILELLDPSGNVASLVSFGSSDSEETLEFGR